MRIRLHETAAGPAGTFLAGEHEVGRQPGHVPLALAEIFLKAGAAVVVDELPVAPDAPAPEPEPEADDQKPAKKTRK